MQSIEQSRRLTWIAVGLIVVGNLVGIAVPAGTGWDFANFYDTGRRVAAGEIANLYDPETTIAGEPPQGGLGFYGTPLSALLYVPMAALPPAWALVAFKIENAIALALAIGWLFAASRRLVDRSEEAQWRFAASFAVGCLLFQPLWTVYRVGGQTTPTVLLLLTLTIIFHTEGKHGLSAAAFAAAVAIKPALITGFAFLVMVSGVRFALVAVASGGLLALASVTLMGWPIHAVFIERMLANANLVWPWFYNSSLFIVIDNVRLWWTGDTVISGADGWFAAAVLALKIAVVVLFAGLMLAARRQEWTRPAADHFRALMAFAFFLLVSQIVWEHYLSFLLPLLAYCIAMRPTVGQSVNRIVVAIFILSIGQNLILVLALRSAIDFTSLAPLIVIGLLKSGPLLGVVLLLTRYRSEIFESFASPAWQSAALSAPVPTLR